MSGGTFLGYPHRPKSTPTGPEPAGEPARNGPAGTGLTRPAMMESRGLGGGGGMIALRTAGVFLAPVTITPTKPLTLSHAKGLLWLDVMYRATREVAPTTYEWNPRVANLT